MLSGDGVHHVAQAVGGLEGGVAGHERHPGGVAAQVDRGEVGVRLDHPAQGGRDAEALGDDDGQHVVAALPDVGGAGEDGDLAGAVELDLHAGVRHVVLVDGVQGAAHVGAGREADPPAGREAGALVVVAALRDGPADGGVEAHAGHLEPVDGLRVRRDEVVDPHGDRVETEGFGHAVEVDLQGEAGLDGAVPPLGPAGRLVSVQPVAEELVVVQPVGQRHEHAEVVGGHHAVAGIGAAVGPGLEVDGGDPSVPGHAHLEPHPGAVPAAVGVEDLLALEDEPHRAPQAQGQGAGADVGGEGVALAPVPGPHVGLDEPQVGRLQPQHLRQGAVHVVRVLRRAVQGQPLPVLASGSATAAVGLPAARGC